MFSKKHIDVIEKYFFDDHLGDYTVEYKNKDSKNAITIFLDETPILDLYHNKLDCYYFENPYDENSKKIIEYGIFTYQGHILRRSFINKIIDILDKVGFDDVY